MFDWWSLEVAHFYRKRFKQVDDTVTVCLTTVKHLKVNNTLIRMIQFNLDDYVVIKSHICKSDANFEAFANYGTHF